MRLLTTGGQSGRSNGVSQSHQQAANWQDPRSARATLGSAYHRATVRGPAWIGWIWLNRLLLTGSLALYVWLQFYTPLTHEFAPWPLEHHSLALPIPW